MDGDPSAVLVVRVWLEGDTDQFRARLMTVGTTQTAATYRAPPSVIRVRTLSMYSAVCLPCRTLGMNACCFFKLSATSTAWKVTAV